MTPMSQGPHNGIELRVIYVITTFGTIKLLTKVGNESFGLD